MLYGDPHVVGFDGKNVLQADSGDFWIVRSGDVSVQARYGNLSTGDLNLPYLPGAITKLAIGGAFLKGHVLVMEPVAGQETWMKTDTLELPAVSAFHVPGLVDMRFHLNNDPIDVNWGPKPSVEMELPLGIRATIDRWPDRLDVMITMPALPGGQDGHCGNFNGRQDDDTLQDIAARMDGARVSAGESLLPGVPEWSANNDPGFKAPDGEVTTRHLDRRARASTSHTCSCPTSSHGA
jgi:hypothetical protein